MDSNFYHIILFTVLLLALLFVFIYLLYRHFTQKIEKQGRESMYALLEAQEKERMYIAKEVHDNLGPLLSITNMQVEAIMQDAGSSPLIHDVHEQLKKSIHICRAISHELTPFPHPDAGLKGMIGEYIQQIGNTKRMNVVFEYKAKDVLIHPKKAASLCRVVLELLNNSIKHAAATGIFLSIEEREKVLAITYRDDGIGMGQSTVSNKGIGIRNIQGRVQLLKGQFQILQGSGFEARIKIPLNELS